MLEFRDAQNQSDKNYWTYKAIKDRMIAWMEYYPALKQRSRFIKNELLNYSAINLTDENDEFRSRRFSDVIGRVLNRSAIEARFNMFSGEAPTKMSENSKYEAMLNYYDINIPEARRIFNSLFVKSIKNRPTFKFQDFTGDTSTQMASKSVNWYLQRMLHKGNWYNMHLIELELNTIAEGTGYIRLEHTKKLDIVSNVFKDNYFFHFVPIYDIIDDGRYTSDSHYDIENSKFVIQMHTWDRDTAIRNFSQYVKKSQAEEATDIASVSAPFDYETFFTDFNALWDRYGNERFKSILVMEVFWKKYNTDTSLEFEWMRTFFTWRNGEMHEVVTIKNDYIYGLPIIKHQHELTTGTPFGYTPTLNNIEIDNARNTVLSSLFHKARENSFTKTYMTTNIANMKDREGNYRLPYRDQDFVVPGMLYAGQSIKNFVQAEERLPLDTSALEISDKVTAEMRQLFDVELPSVNRTSASAYSMFLEATSEKFQPMFISDAKRDTTLGHKLYSILQSYTEQEKEAISEQYRRISGSQGLKLLNIGFKFPNPADAGLAVTMSSEEEAIKSSALDRILGITDRFGLEALTNEDLIDLTGLRKSGYETLQDKEKQNTLIDILDIVNGNITTMEEVEQRVLKLTTLEGEGTQVTDFSLMNHKLAFEVIATWINVNKAEYLSLEPEKRQLLLMLVNLHKEGLMAQQQEQLAMQQAQATAEQPQQAQEQQITPEMIQQLAQQ